MGGSCTKSLVGMARNSLDVGVGRDISESTNDWLISWREKLRLAQFVELWDDNDSKELMDDEIALLGFDAVKGEACEE